MHRTMRQHPRRALLLLGVLAVSAQAALAQLLPPLQPFEPLQPMQPFKPFAPLPPMQPMPGFPPFPEFPHMQMPAFPTMGTSGGAAAAGRAGGPGVYSSSSASSFGGPRASTTPGCQVVQETSGESMGSSKAGQSSCKLAQRVEICKSDKPGSKGHTRAVASVNGQEATCCVVLLKLPAKTPQLFCASPIRSPSFMRMPAADTAVVMKPECSSSTATGRSVGSVSCTVTFSQLPEGFTYPEGYTAASPLVLHRGSGSKAFAASNSNTSGTSTGPSAGRSGFVPCNNKQFKKFVQATSRSLPNGGVILTSKCD